jgi:hypothetical protein
VQGLCTTNRSRRRALEIVKLCLHLFTNALPHVPSANEAATIRLQRTSRYEQAAVREIKQPAQGYAATNRGGLSQSTGGTDVINLALIMDCRLSPKPIS